MATYGTPETIHSDNGTNFVGAEKELVWQLREMENNGELQDWTKKKGIRRIFRRLAHHIPDELSRVWYDLRNWHYTEPWILRKRDYANPMKKC